MLSVTHLIGFGVGGDAITFTKLLLHGEGADASTTFTDSSLAPHTVSRTGNTQIDTAQFKFGSASILFDGTGDSLTLDGSTDFAYGTSDFTIDFWLRFNSVPSAAGDIAVLYDGRAAEPSVRPLLYVSNADDALRYWVNGVEVITGTTAISGAAWHHVALARSGTSTKLFLAGTQEGSTYSDSNDYANSASLPRMGLALGGTGGLNGWLDEYRISKGVARWTANFTPPSSAYTAD